jgi:glycosyltransferase involved in cell wall biosynthesis
MKSMEEKILERENSACMPLISVVIPAYNEARGIAHTVGAVAEELRKIAADCEIIVVDDGSKDGTFEALRSLAPDYPCLKALRLSRNFGKEAALLSGLKAARGAAVITMDSDLQHPPALIPQFVAKWREGFAVVHAIKQDRKADTVLVRWRAAVFNRIFTSLAGFSMENSSDFILLDRAAVEVIIHQLPERMRFYRGITRWIGFRQTFIYFTVAERWDHSQTRWRLKALLKLASDSIVSFTTIPLRIVTLFGFVTLAIGLIVGLDAIISYLRGAAVSGFITTIGVLLVLGSFIMISLGIIGEYIAKIYGEVKARPISLVEYSFGFAEEKSAIRQNLPKRSG